MKTRRCTVLLAGLLVVVAGCDSGIDATNDEIEARPFTGEWFRLTKYADPRNPLVKDIFSVVTDGHRFRVLKQYDNRFTMPDWLVVYDGTNASTNGHFGQGTYESPLWHADAFWFQRNGEKRRKTRTVCGRKTRLWSLEYDEDGFRYTEEYWADRETGLVIERVETTTKLATNTVVHRAALECQSIIFGPVDDSAFEHPPESPIK